jgi:hypothetical protein
LTDAARHGKQSRVIAVVRDDRDAVSARYSTVNKILVKRGIDIVTAHKSPVL